tara:strand:+ start:3680 stop:4276 length:597 start_codon:yes stop_codon:yes gene_type:complete
MKYLEVVTHHNTQIVSTADLKEHLRITFTDDDNYIEGLEKAAVHRIEEFCNIFMLDTALIQYGFTINDLNILYKSPLLSADSSATPVIEAPRVQAYVTGAWTTQTTGIEFIERIKPPRVYVLSSATLLEPDDVFQKWRAVYNVGYKTIAEIPDPLIQCIKIIVADMYENRQSVIVGKIVSEIPRTAQYLMNPYKIQTL